MGATMMKLNGAIVFLLPAAGYEGLKNQEMLRKRTLRRSARYQHWSWDWPLLWRWFFFGLTTANRGQRAKQDCCGADEPLKQVLPGEKQPSPKYRYAKEQVEETTVSKEL